MSYKNIPKPQIVLKAKTTLRKSDRTQQSILDAALDYLWTQPYRSLTVSELMSKAGSSRSVFYRYYEDLPTMMEHLLNEFEEKIMAATTAWFTEESDPIPLLKESLGLHNHALLYSFQNALPFQRAFLSPGIKMLLASSPNCKTEMVPVSADMV